MSMPSPEIGRSIVAAGIRTNYHDVGDGFPLLMIHGSGPGVSAWANWRLVLELAKARAIAPDMRASASPSVRRVSTTRMLRQVGTLTRWHRARRSDEQLLRWRGPGMTIRHPQRVRRLVLMGSVGVPFEIWKDWMRWGLRALVREHAPHHDYFAWDRCW